MTKIKLCGLFREVDIDYANAVQPDFIGFVIGFPKSHRNITEEQASILRRRLDPSIQAVGVFVDAPIPTVQALCEAGTIDLVQLHGNEDANYIRALRAVTDKPIVKAFVVNPEFDLEAAEQSEADYILLDGGKGEGKAFAYETIKGIRRPFFLAGGLHTGNIPDAIAQLHPFCVDVSTGVETDGVKDYEKMRVAVKAAHEEDK